MSETPRSFLRRAVSSVLVMTILGTAVTAFSIVITPAASAVAAGAAPTFPKPACVEPVGGPVGLGCLPGDEGGSISGSFAAGGEFTVITSPGISACVHYTQTGCYYDIYNPSLVRCVYLANNDPNDVRSCNSLSTQG